jgi:putative heme iron utilization protein
MSNGKQRRGWPSLISDDLLQKIEGEIRANQCEAIKRVPSHHSQSVLKPQFMKL